LNFLEEIRVAKKDVIYEFTESKQMMDDHINTLKHELQLENYIIVESTLG